mmetsp:Transcript_17697/g.38661  ORF Transcript_17697/g.38661 Transcript_17697/m.38661 type:complete len:207 (+) Transcript_17697:1170-1790(+)
MMTIATTTTTRARTRRRQQGQSNGQIVAFRATAGEPNRGEIQGVIVAVTFVVVRCYRHPQELRQYLFPSGFDPPPGFRSEQVRRRRISEVFFQVGCHGVKDFRVDRGGPVVIQVVGFCLLLLRLGSGGCSCGVGSCRRRQTFAAAAATAAATTTTKPRRQGRQVGDQSRCLCGLRVSHPNGGGRCSNERGPTDRRHDPRRVIRVRV